MRETSTLDMPEIGQDANKKKMSPKLKELNEELAALQAAQMSQKAREIDMRSVRTEIAAEEARLEEDQSAA